MSQGMSGGGGAGAGATSGGFTPPASTSASTGPDFPTSGGTTSSGVWQTASSDSLTSTNGGSGPSSASKLGSGMMGAIPIIGPILSGVGSIFAAQAEGKADDNRAILYSQQALLDKYNAGTEVKANQDRATQTMSAATAQAGGAGVTTAGSPTEAVRKTINDANVADVKARWIGAIKSSSDMYQSQLARYAGSQARLSGWIQGGSDFAQAGMQGASIF